MCFVNTRKIMVIKIISQMAYLVSHTIFFFAVPWFLDSRQERKANRRAMVLQLFFFVEEYVQFFASADLDWHSLLAYWNIWIVRSSTQPGRHTWATVNSLTFVSNSSLTAWLKKASGINGWIAMKSKVHKVQNFYNICEM